MVSELRKQRDNLKKDSEELRCALEQKCDMLSQVQRNLSSTKHSQRKQRIEKSLQVYGWMKEQCPDFKRKQANYTEPNLCVEARRKFYQWQKIPFRSDCTEQYRLNVRIFCSLVLHDANQRMFHSFVKHRRDQIAQMSNLDVKAQFSYRFLLNLPSEHPTRVGNYVFAGPNAVYLGKGFATKCSSALFLTLANTLRKIPVSTIDLIETFIL